MQRKQLGRSGLSLPAVSFGAWAIGGWYWGGTDDAAARVAIEAALDLGMDALDTAPVYGFGHSERVIGAALVGQRERALLLTKVGLDWVDRRGPPFFEAQDGSGQTLRVHRNARPDAIVRQCEESLERLRTDHVDLLQIHWPDPETPVEDSIGALVELLRQGKTRAIGVSNFTPELLERAQRALGTIPLASTQERYSLMSRNIERALVPWCVECQVGILAYSPLEQGLLTGAVTPERVLAKADRRNDKATFSPANRRAILAKLEQAARPLARRHGATLAQIVLAATAARAGIATVLAGARNATQVRENARAGELTLAPAEVDALWRSFADLDLKGAAFLSRVMKRILGRA